MTHGPIFFEILRQIFNLKVIQGESLVILDAPLLFESKILEYLCHPIMVVTLKDVETQRERLMARNKNLSKDEAMSKIKAQMPMNVRKAKADIVVDNSGTRYDLERKLVKDTVPNILRELRLDYETQT